LSIVTTSPGAEHGSTTDTAGLTLTPVASFPRMRVLAWAGNILYASRGYTLLKANFNAAWESVGRYSPQWWRKLSSSSRLASRLVRDGFHALAILPSGDIVAAVPGAILRLAPGERRFQVTHKVIRGSRPLHITATPRGDLYWGEYFDNPQREEVHIYASPDQGNTWNVAYTFPRGAVRHVHNIVYDEWGDCLWVLTGDNGGECRILRASCDFRTVDVVMSGNQQSRAVAFVPTPEALFFTSDTPLEANYVYRLDRKGNLAQLAGLNSSSIYGCRVGEAVFFSTMVEPSTVNSDPHVRIYGSANGGANEKDWPSLLAWKKDQWSMRFFQYGNAFLPDGRNSTNLLAFTTIAVDKGDQCASVWRVT